MIPKITEALDVRLKELNEQLIQFNDEIKLQKDEYLNQFTSDNTTIAELLKEICRKIG